MFNMSEWPLRVLVGMLTCLDLLPLTTITPWSFIIIVCVLMWIKCVVENNIHSNPVKIYTLLTSSHSVQEIIVSGSVPKSIFTKTLSRKNPFRVFPRSLRLTVSSSGCLVSRLLEWTRPRVSLTTPVLVVVPWQSETFSDLKTWGVNQSVIDTRRESSSCVGESVKDSSVETRHLPLIVLYPWRHDNRRWPFSHRVRPFHIDFPWLSWKMSQIK